METLRPDKIVEWIPYNNLRNIKYLTKGGCSEIYTADWINGGYDEWNSKEKQLERKGRHKVILKRLESIESANRSWFEEAKSHLAYCHEIHQILKSYNQNENNEYSTNIYNSQLNLSISPSSGSINSSIRTYLSKTHSFKDLPEPRNATKEEQEAYYSLQNDLSLPDSMYIVNNI
ncbi:unnamed protein product [Rhizophagus irregularis]|nr:unnamed protein product [Rhizophagus irregularis]